MPVINVVLGLTGLLLVLTLSSCSAALPESGPALSTTAYSNGQLLATPEWLAAHLKDADLRFLDIRSSDEYKEGHIPGAVNITLPQITDESNSAVDNVAPPGKIENVMGDAGVDNNTTVVVYDDGRNLMAARMFWVLEYYGHPRVKLLNGGFDRWRKEGREMTRVVPQPAKARFTARPDASRLATKAQVEAVLGKSDIALVDTRSAQEYKADHIFGALNVDWVNNLTSASASAFKSARELEKLYEGAGVTRDKEVITYCQTGMRAANTYFTLRLLGYDRVRLYDGSWQEWASASSTPTDMGDSCT
ncbi:MAG: sulfurtransferase [Chloroflexi bacterium]|nr:sulfurtransferase [Chloroflexota bacterium]